MTNVLYIICTSEKYIFSISQNNKIIKTNNRQIENNEKNVFIEGFLNILQQCHLNINDLKNIVISTNPQTYTGIRIVYSFLAGISFSLNIKVVEINLLNLYLETIKKQFPNIDDKYICILLNAKNNNFYTISQFNNTQILYGKYNLDYLKTEFVKYKNIFLFTEDEKIFSKSNCSFIKNFNDIELIDNICKISQKAIENNLFIDFDDLNVEYL